MVSNDKKNAKLKHINACLLEESQYKKSAGFDEFDFILQSVPEIALQNVCLKTKFLEHTFNAPLMIAPMTGGMELGLILNERWAKAAQHFGIGFGVGSQRLALEDESVKKTFQVRKHAKSAFIFANLGATQLVKWGNQKAFDAVKMLEANAIFIHLNPLQEVCQENGDTDFSHVLKAISDLVHYFVPQKIPVFVREVGFGFSKNAAKKIIETGISGIDCAGAGGTSWSKVESMCAAHPLYKELGECFAEIGIKTADSIQNVRSTDKNIPLIATGGLRSGLDIAKALALGANLGSMGQPMLKAAVVSEEALFSFIEQILLQLKVAMFTAGLSKVEHLNQNVLIKK